MLSHACGGQLTPYILRIVTIIQGVQDIARPMTEQADNLNEFAVDYDGGQSDDEDGYY